MNAIDALSIQAIFNLPYLLIGILFAVGAPVKPVRTFFMGLFGLVFTSWGKFFLSSGLGSYGINVLGSGTRTEVMLHSAWNILSYGIDLLFLIIIIITAVVIYRQYIEGKKKIAIEEPTV